MINKENAFFQNQIKESSDYFEKWLYPTDSKFFLYEGLPIKESVYFSKLDFLHYNNSNEYRHNCLPCNLTSGGNLILKFLQNSLSCDDIRYFVNIFSLLLYQQAEKHGVVYSLLGYKNKNDEFDWEKFPNLQKIKYWANFFKHPKATLLLHHPTYHIESYNHNPNFLFDGKINNDFVYNYFKGKKKNKELFEILSNKNYKIFFPDLLEFTKNACNEFNKIFEIINQSNLSESEIERLKEFRENNLYC